MISASVPQIAIARTRQRTSLAPGDGQGTSLTTNACGAVRTSACMSGHERDDAADAGLATDPAPRERADIDASTGHLRQLTSEVLEHRDVLLGHVVMDVLEVLHREGLVDRLPGQLLVLLHEIRTEVADPHVQRVIHRRNVAADHLHALGDQVIADLRLWTGVAIEVHDVISRGLRPVIPIPPRVEEDDVALADLLALRQAAD